MPSRKSVTELKTHTKTLMRKRALIYYRTRRAFPKSGDDLRAIAETIAEAVALSEPVNDAKDVVKGGVISSYSLSPEKVASTDYKDLSVGSSLRSMERQTLAL